MHGRRSKFVRGFQVFFQTEEELSKRDDIDVDALGSEFGLASPKNTKYSLETLLFRDILSYCLEIGTEKYFQSREISRNWILKRNEWYRKHYSGSDAKSKDAVKAENINRTIRDYLRQLVHLEILKPNPKVSHTRENTTEYKFTNFGMLLALIIELDKLRREKVLQEPEILERLHVLLEKGFGYSNTSIDRFCSTMYRKLVHKQLFHFIANHYKNVLKNNRIENRNQFFRYSLLTQSSEESSEELWQVYKESLEELKEKDRQTYNIFLYNLKLEIESLQESKSRGHRKFEEYLFDNKEFETVAVIEGLCDNCKMYTVGVTEILKYLEHYFSKNKVRDICQQCGIGYLDYEMIT